MIPNKIKIVTDGSELEYQSTEVKNNKGIKLPNPLHVFKYIKGKAKLGMELKLTDNELIKLIEIQKIFS